MPMGRFDPMFARGRLCLLCSQTCAFVHEARVVSGCTIQPAEGTIFMRNGTQERWTLRFPPDRDGSESVFREEQARSTVQMDGGPAMHG